MLRKHTLLVTSFLFFSILSLIISCANDLLTNGAILLFNKSDNDSTDANIEFVFVIS